MKIPVYKIPDGGEKLPVDDKQEWLVKVFESLRDGSPLCIDVPSLSGHIELNRYGEEVHCQFNIGFSYKTQCAHCGEDLNRKIDLKWDTHLSPWKPDPKQPALAEDEEIELTADDLNFSFYENEEVDLEPLLNDEISLSMPYNDYCEDTQACKQRLQAYLSAKTDPDVDPRWADLRNFKTKN